MITVQFKILAFLVWVCVLPALGAADQTPGQEHLEWSELPPLPPVPGQEKQLGLAGSFVGIHQNALIVAGGANFPDTPAWEGGQKVWWDDVFVLEKTAEGNYQWVTDIDFKLPQPSAYGVSISTPDGIVCIGGCDVDSCHNSVFLLTWDSETKKISTEMMPSLPRSLAFMAGTMVGHTLYVAGGQEKMKEAQATKNFFALDLSKKSDADQFKWHQLDAWPGPARIVNVAASQSDGENDCLYMFSGRNPMPGKSTKLLTDAYKYNPKSNKWMKLADIAPDGEQPRCVMAATAIDSEDNQILVFGGDSGDVFLELEQLDQEGNKAKHTQLQIDHPGFSQDILAYDGTTDTWSKAGKLPTTSHVTTSIVNWDGSMVIPSGEFRPGVRTPRIWKAEPVLTPVAKTKPFPTDNANIKAAPTANVTSWLPLPDLPYSPGVAGPFVGVHEEALIIAGGTSLQELAGKTRKIWHDNIWILIKDQNGSYQWIDRFKLDRPLANGAAVSTDQGVVCLGGNDASRTYAEVFILSWNKKTQKLDRRTLPALPKPCAFTSSARIKAKTSDMIYVAGGRSGTGQDAAMKNFWALDLTKKTSDPTNFTWQEILPWPGPPRAANLTIHQHNGKADCIYVIGGQNAAGENSGNNQNQMLTDVYEFNPSQYDAQKYDPQTGDYAGTGLQANPWSKRAGLPRAVSAGTGISTGQSHIFVFGGGDDSINLKGENPITNGSAVTDELLMYHTITNTWIVKDSIPGNYMKTIPVYWNDAIVLAGGELRPNVPSAKIWQVKSVKGKKFFGVINFSVIAIYLVVLIGVGVFFFFRQKNTDDYFRGGKRLPWFVAGCSIFATMLSSLTFIAIPAKAFMADWAFIIINVCIFALAPFIVRFILPFFRRIDATSAYEYLEKRFNLAARLFGSASFILFQIGRMAIVMFLTALPLAAITPLSVVQCILIMGVMSIIYCTLGGLEAVAWTDTIQTFVLMGGAILSLVIIIMNLKGGVGEFFTIAAADQKFHVINWDWSSVSFATTALWVVVLGGIGQNMVPYISDMAVVQRYMSVSDEKRAAKAIWTNAIAAIPAGIIFFGLGTALYVFYKSHPDRLDPTFQNDAIFPLFIAHELPVGLAGLVVAGVFSAAQSTLSTSMNSTSTAFVTDFIRRFNLVNSDGAYLNLARLMTVVFGSLGTGFAVLCAMADIKSLWEAAMAFIGLFGGAMCGLFILGIFTERSNGIGAVIGAVTGALGLFLIQRMTQVHFLLYAIVGITICFIVGYLTSLMIPAKQKRIEGLTIYSLKKNRGRSGNVSHAITLF